MLARSMASLAMARGIMEREETGPDRLRGRLPAGTRVANKTGTSGTVVANDVGIVSLPGRAGHLALAVFTEDSTTDLAAKARQIADLAGVAHDHFVLAATGR